MPSGSIPTQPDHAGALAGFFNLLSLVCEYMQLLGNAFSQIDIGMTTVRSLQSSLSGRFTRKDSDLVAIFVPQGKISHLFLDQDVPSAKLDSNGTLKRYQL